MEFTKEEREWYEYQRSKQTKKVIYKKDDKQTRKEIRDYKRKQKELSKLPSKYRVYLHSAQKRKHVFELTIDQFNTILNNVCVYCGSNDKIGVDRKDNNIGYVLSNCQSCCSMCNMFKYKYTEKQFIEHVNKIYTFMNTHSH